MSSTAKLNNIFLFFIIEFLMKRKNVINSYQKYHCALQKNIQTIDSYNVTCFKLYSYLFCTSKP